MKKSNIQFKCPFCSTVETPYWYRLNDEKIPAVVKKEIKKLEACYCSKCKEISLWKDNKVLLPKMYEIIKPDKNLPDLLKEAYVEAWKISRFSTRSASALLRQIIQKIFIMQGEQGTDPEIDVINLANNGLPQDLNDELKKCKYIGDEKIAPGLIRAVDDEVMVKNLAKLINKLSKFYF